MMRRNLLSLLVLTLLCWAALTLAKPALAQAPPGREYVVQADDWLSKLAEKEYGDPLAFPIIVDATNAKAAEDSSFSLIQNPDVIEVGQKLWLPDETGQAQAETPAEEPAPPTAEPAPAATTEAKPLLKPVGIYKAMLPAASSPGIDSTLYLNFDNTVWLIEDYLAGGRPILEMGSWAVVSNTVAVTITGQEGQPYDEPVEISYNLAGDILATTPDEDLYGSAGRQYLRFEPLAFGQAPPYDQAAAEQLMAGGLPGIYKGFSPAASSPGLDWTLFLNADNTATLKTDYLDGEILLETGNWAVTDDNLEVSLAGSGKPLSFTIAEGTLVSNDFSIFGQKPLRLYRFEVIAGSAVGRE
jgi:uncharacterized lipoprotein NlpE involved in copper resistance